MLIGNSSSATSISTSTAGGQSSADKQQIDSDLNRFLKLLVTQLQHQDPLQPMDANQFTQQLVQFASVEQQIYQNANLEKLVGMQKGAQMGSVINYLGSMVEVEGKSMTLQGGNAAASYTLDDAAAQTALRVTDMDGNVVLTRAGETTAGAHTFTWDGIADSGKPLPDGSYQLQVEAKRRDGTSVDVTTRVLALVSGIASDGDQPELIVGDERVPLADVLSVSIPASPAAATEK